MNVKILVLILIYFILASELDELNKEKEDTVTSELSTEDDIKVEEATDTVDLPQDDSCYFKLGMKSKFQSYKNQYHSNTLAKSKLDAQTEREKRRIISNKFSLGDFRWIGSCYRGELGQVSTLQNTIVNLENLLPAAFVHPNWYKERSTWIQAVKLCTEVNHFSSVLMYFEEVIKPIIMVPSWKETCGCMKWNRIQGELKPNKAKPKKSEKEKLPIEIVSDEEMEDVPSNNCFFLFCFVLQITNQLLNLCVDLFNF